MGIVSRLVLAVLLAVAAGGSCGVQPPTVDPNAKTLFEAACSRCHSLDIPLSRHRNLEAWRRTVATMRERGALLTDDEGERIARYLAAARPAR